MTDGCATHIITDLLDTRNCQCLRLHPHKAHSSPSQRRHVTAIILHCGGLKRGILVDKGRVLAEAWGVKEKSAKLNIEHMYG